MSELDFIKEIRIAQYWRNQLGDLGYVKRDPDDLQRWYEALENRGPEEIRAYLIERAGRHPMGEVTGIVAKGPHPSREIIDVWLASHEKTHTMPYWIGFAAFLLACLVVAPNVSGCQHLHSLSSFPHGAPPEASLAPGANLGAPPSLSMVPGQFPLPANSAGTQNQRSGQASQ